MQVHRTTLLIVGVLMLVGSALWAAPTSDERMKAMQGSGSAMSHPVVSVPFYQEHTFMLLAGFAIPVAGYVVFRIARRRRGQKVAPAGFVHEAALVVDMVNSTHVSTHYGNGLAMRARSTLKERALNLAEARGMTFSRDTGDGYFMTFASVPAAVQSAIELLKGLRDRPPDLSPGPPIAVRVGISYGEILLDNLGGRNGAAINKAFRIEGLTPESFSRMKGEDGLDKFPAHNRIFLDEDAVYELRSSDISIRTVGYCKMKGFSGLHQIFEVLWDKNTLASAGQRDVNMETQHSPTLAKGIQGLPSK